MTNYKTTAKMLKAIFQAITKAKAKGVKDPERITLETIKAQTNWNKFKSKYKLR